MSDDATVIPLTPKRMTEVDYDRERQRIRDLFGDSKSDAGARWEQALAKLFWESGWTQDELAAKESKSQTWVQRRLRFGRFLTFLENSPSGPNSLIVTERRFREYWEHTEGSNERRRFREVTEMIEVDARAPSNRNINPVMNAIREEFSDGKWHAPEAIARRVEKSIEEIEKILSSAASRGNRRYKVERRGHGARQQFRIFPTEKTVSTLELAEKLVPLITELKAEGRKNMATIAISRIAKIAAELQEMLDEWTR